LVSQYQKYRDTFTILLFDTTQVHFVLVQTISLIKNFKLSIIITVNI